MSNEWLHLFYAPDMLRPLFAAVLIGFTNGVLSVFIVLRRLSLMADAISHSLLPGLAIAILLFGLAPATLVAGAFLAALLVALGTQIIANSTRIKEDTALGLLFACAFSLGQALLKLALGTLIGPAATVYLFVDSFTVMFWVSGLLGAFASFLGLLVSDWTDLPAGACIVLVLGVLFLVSFLLSPRYGLLRRVRKGHLHAQSLARWEAERQ